jgi:hypothetical protein
VRAGDLAKPEGLVSVTDTVLDAARRMVEESLAGLAVVSGSGVPLAVLPASQVLGLAVPIYVKDDPSLARVVDEAAADRLAQRLTGMTVQDVLDDAEPDLLATVRDTATLLEAAARMARQHVPLLVVTDASGMACGTVSARALLRASLSMP